MKYLIADEDGELNNVHFLHCARSIFIFLPSLTEGDYKGVVVRQTHKQLDAGVIYLVSDGQLWHAAVHACTSMLSTVV